MTFWNVDSGVVDEDVHGAVLLGDTRPERLDCIGIGNVERLHEHGPAFFANCLGGFFQWLGAPPG